MKRLLLVDDDAAFLKILSSLLQRDFQVYEAMGVEEALKTLDVVQIHAICSDFNMKDGAGIELLERLYHEKMEYRIFLCRVMMIADLLKP